MRRIFINSSERRLRSGWRVLPQWLMYIVFLSVLIALISVNLFDLSLVGLIKSKLLDIVALLASVLLAHRFMDKRPLSGGTFSSALLQDV